MLRYEIDKDISYYTEVNKEFHFLEIGIRLVMCSYVHRCNPKGNSEDTGYCKFPNHLEVRVKLNKTLVSFLNFLELTIEAIVK